MTRQLMKSFLAIGILTFLVLIAGFFLARVIDNELIDPVCVQVICEEPWGYSDVTNMIVVNGYDVDFKCTDWETNDETGKDYCDMWAPTYSKYWTEEREKYSLPQEVEFKKCMCSDMMSEEIAKERFIKVDEPKQDGSTL